jgi:hypothetical protein
MGARCWAVAGQSGRPGRTARDNRLFVNGTLWVLRSVATGTTCPSDTASGRGSIPASHAGPRQVFKALIEDPKNEYLMLDTILLRAHQQAVTGKGETKTRPWGPEED